MRSKNWYNRRPKEQQTNIETMLLNFLISGILKNLGFITISLKNTISIQLICIIYFNVNMEHIMIYVLWINSWLLPVTILKGIKVEVWVPL